jgi:lipid-A-disaccharide synthase
MKSDHKKLFIFSGEPSGDLHGSHLSHLLKEKGLNLSIEGVAGPKMRQEGVKGPLTMEDFEVMGLTDVICALPKLYRHFYCIQDTILKNIPDAVVLIDYPGFNLRLAKALRKNGFKGKIIHYISPSVWAWGKHRIAEMEKNIDLLLTVYPFEADHFSHTTLSVKYVGSPLQEYISQYRYDNNWQKKLGISGSQFLIALFPGSRKKEIARNLPLILEAAALLKQQNPSIIFGISCFNKTALDFLEKYKARFPTLENALYAIPKDNTYELMRDSRCAIAKSGTVTLELALHGCPTVVVYQLSFLNRLYATYVLKLQLSYYCIVNILAQKEVFPELIENNVCPLTIFEQIKSLISDGPKRQACIQECQQIDVSLGCRDANTRAAEAILRLIS